MLTPNISIMRGKNSIRWLGNQIYFLPSLMYIEFEFWVIIQKKNLYTIIYFEGHFPKFITKKT
jgi:hypothetical protein